MAFKFNKNVVLIEIEDEKFHVSADKRCIEAFKAASKASKELQESGNCTDETVIAMYRKTIDDILGKGASDKIFVSDREFVIADYVEVYAYIVNEITNFMNSRMPAVPRNVKK